MKIIPSLFAATACSTLALALVNDASAAPRTHDGFYLSLEGGFGYLSSTVEVLNSEQTMSGATLSSGLLMGGTIGNLVIGGGLTYDNAFSPSVEQGDMEVELDDVELYLIGMGVFADYYLDPQAGGLHILGFLGWGGLEASVGGDVGGSDPTGALFTVGGGYDFWMADEWSIGPLLRLTYAPLSLNDTDYSTTQVSLVADLKWH